MKKQNHHFFCVFVVLLIFPLFLYAGPTLNSPPNHSSGFSNPLSLHWNSTPGASTYSLQISKDSDFSYKIINLTGITENSHVFTGIVDGTTFFWRVRAVNSSNQAGDWSDTWSFAGMYASNWDRFKFGEQKQIYYQSTIEADAPAATLQDGKTLTIFRSTSTMIQKSWGPLSNPQQKFNLKRNNSDVFKIPSYLQSYISFNYNSGKSLYANIYLTNVIKVNSSPKNQELIGIVHLEKDQRINSDGKPDFPAKYAIGLAYSNDLGDNWVFLGDIIHPHFYMNDYNIGGCPTLIIGDYLYIYFNEWANDRDGNLNMWPGVARAKWEIIKVEARKTFNSMKNNPGNPSVFTGNVKFKKHEDDNAPFAGDGFSGTAKPIASLPDNAQLDTHNDAVYCKAINKYLLTLKANRRCTQCTPKVVDIAEQLYMFESDDGVNWKNPLIVAESQTHRLSAIPSYSFFASLENTASTDCRSVDKNFVIYYQMHYFDPNPQDRKMSLFCKKINIVIQ